MATPIVLQKTFVEGQGWVAYHPQTSGSAIIQDATNRLVTDTQIASWNAAETNAVAYVDTRIAELIDGAPSQFDTLRELAEAFEVTDGAHEGILTAIGDKAAKTYVDEQLALKANVADVNTALDLKADKETVTAALEAKADQSAVVAALATKVETTELQTTVETLNTAIDAKANAADLATVTMGEAATAPLNAPAGSIFLEVVSA